ncbi:HAMP domain-containing sensor histidine kinase [Novosphingobium sp.]|uniref:sensor histidine kinase n=1 Tax=Novosphingobium sp. TaxID=1874826 RepID=UPI0031D7810D
MLLLLAMGGSILGLLLGFSLSLMAASRQFEHALIAQQQAALVADLARDAEGLSAPALRDNLAAYRALIQQERQFLSPRQQQAQSDELARADALALLAGRPEDRARLVAMVRAIDSGEQHEVAAARADLTSIRRDTILLGVLLALTALGAAAVGLIQLQRANRDLAQEVAARTADLRAIDSSRRLFFAKASHELRTPVTAIRVMAEVALDSGADASSPLRDIVAQTTFLNHRIEELLALSSAAEGRPVMAPEPCDLAEVLATAALQAQPYAASIGVTIRQAQAPAPLIALADRRWLTQAVLAVIDNGLKFSDPGGDLDLALDSDGQIAAITLADHGPGVLPRELPRIFDAYYQAEAGKTRGGTGLGLALARWVVEQHGGGIHAENRDGGGCRIVIQLPLAREEVP